MANILGTAGNDVMVGTTEADRMEGGEGNDRINGGAGDDEIYGGVGNDTLTGDAGNDRLFGEDGNDGFYGGGGNDYIDGGNGDDVLFGDGGNDVLIGGAGNDRLNGGTGDDTFIYRAGDGNDVIVGGQGNDTLELVLTGADVTDALRSDLAAYQVWAAGQLVAAGSQANLVAQTTGETFTFASLGLSISALEGVTVSVDGQTVAIADLLNAAPVAAANASFAIAEDSVLEAAIVASDADGDVLTYVMESGPSHGSLSLDSATGHFIYTPAGNFSGADSFSVRVTDPDGASVVQTVNVGVAAVADAAILTADDVTVSLKRPTITGTSGNDVLRGDQTVASATVSLAIAAALQDLDGSETLSVRIDGVPARATLSAGVRNADGSWTLSAANLAGLMLTTPTSQPVTLKVTATATEQSGETVSVTDTVEVRFDHGAPNDTFIASTGNDTYDGRTGFDTVDYSAIKTAVKVDLSDSSATGPGKQTLISIERVIGTAFNDRIIGSSGDDVLEAGAGDDRVEGGAGNDVLIDGAGNDRYDGGTGNDVMIDAAGDDRYDGGAGDDVMIDGAGNDRYDGGTGNDVMIDGAGNDRYEGGSGDDVMFDGAGDDRYDGGTGVDTLNYSTSTQGIVVDADSETISGMGKDRYSSIEKIIGSKFADRFHGSNGDDVFEGGAGNDWFRGFKGADVFTGGEGRDTFVWHEEDVSRSRKSEGVDRITDFSAGDVLDLSDIANGSSRAVMVTDTKAGSVVSVKMGSTFYDVALLENVHGVTTGSLLADGSLIV